jgi:hypothetical protein
MHCHGSGGGEENCEVLATLMEFIIAAVPVPAASARRIRVVLSLSVLAASNIYSSTGVA